MQTICCLSSKEEEARMLDIGTGASLIYPLLGTAAFNWECVGSEVDKEAISYAKGLIRMNASMLGTKIRRQEFKSNILPGIIEKKEQFDLLVCNPPFYKNKSEALAANARKNKNLHGREKTHHNFGGSANELWYKGGEEAFLKKLATRKCRIWIANSLVYLFGFKKRTCPHLQTIHT